MRKKVDSRIRTLVENCVKLRQRSMFVIVGDKGRDQVVNLHYMLSKMAVKARPSVLWCYKKDLYLSSHRKKRTKQIQRMAKSGLLDAGTEDPFALFVASTNIRYCFYSETHKVLGNTYGMLVLQDFEALTPNLLARTVETVEGGGIVVLLLSSMRSLTQLYDLTMDAHARFRTEGHGEVVPRFNERLVLSLAACPACLLADDELNVLGASKAARTISALGPDFVPPTAKDAAELAELASSLADAQPAGALVSRCATLDQARAVVTFLDAASERTLRGTVALTAARGRGKSAALGLALAGAVAMGYSNIFVSSPTPENLRTLFEFLLKGLEELGYKESLDFDCVESTNAAFNKALVRVNVFRDHRQTIQYVQPQHHQALAQAELLVIDEAAAIPLPVVRSMLGPYLVFVCSTVSGYEGTGRSLSLKLIQQLKAQGVRVASGGAAGAAGAGLPAAASSPASSASAVGSRTFREIVLRDPIRYAPGDRVERWLNELLCLDAAEHLPPPPARLPHPSECELYAVSRDTLFSYHAASEAFLQRVMSLYVSSHYKNTPNDLLLLADAPAHRLFVLLGPVDASAPPGTLPDVLAVLQVALEGKVSRGAAKAALAAGQLPAGDLIPWTVAQQFQDPDFPSLSGARVVRIATHPGLTRAGYGSRALEALRRHYEGELLDADLFAEDGDRRGARSSDKAAGKAAKKAAKKATGADQGAGGADRDASALLADESVAPRADLPPLLVSLADVEPERLQYLGVACGLTPELHGFWRRAGYKAVYIRQTSNDVTGEHSVVMLRALHSDEVAGGAAWLDPFVVDFRTRFAALLHGPFRGFPPALALGILEARLQWSDLETARTERGEDEPEAGRGPGGEGAGGAAAAAPRGGPSGFRAAPARGCAYRADGSPLTPYDLRRLEAYARGLVDHHLIADLVPALAAAFFAGGTPTTLSPAQAAILLVLGLQCRDISAAGAALGLPAAHVLALFAKTARRLHGHLAACRAAALERAAAREAPRITLPQADAELARGLEEELDEAEAEIRREFGRARAEAGAAAEAEAEDARAGGGADRPEEDGEAGEDGPDREAGDATPLGLSNGKAPTGGKEAKALPPAAVERLARKYAVTADVTSVDASRLTPGAMVSLPVAAGAPRTPKTAPDGRADERPSKKGRKTPRGEGHKGSAKKARK